jgi:hypothetical protein
MSLQPGITFTTIKVTVCTTELRVLDPQLPHTTKSNTRIYNKNDNKNKVITTTTAE